MRPEGSMEPKCSSESMENVWNISYTVKAPFIRQWFCLIFKDPDRSSVVIKSSGDGGLVRGIYVVWLALKAVVITTRLLGA